jgi:hypothetical protein
MEKLAEREAAGESLWAPGFSQRVRTRILYSLRRIHSASSTTTEAQLFEEARRLIVEQEGLYKLVDTATSPADDFFKYYQVCGDDMFPTVIEAVVVALGAADDLDSQFVSWNHGWPAEFVKVTNEIFAQERVGWEIIGGRMIEIHSKELHEAAIEPALRLLHGREFAKADKAYRDALEELSQGRAADAITDAGTALQEALTSLGCEGNQLGDLIRSAKKKGLLATHDDPLTQAIEKLMHWVAADRSQMGDAHHATDASREDAWLIVHVVGAIIVRLASGTPRSD